MPARALRLYVQLDPDGHGRARSDDEERGRIAGEEAAAGCPPSRVSAGHGDDPGLEALTDAPLHHSVRLAWEYRDVSGAWRAVAAVDDETRAFTLDGHVVVHLPPDPPMGPTVVGSGETPRFHLRCRLAGGRYDAAPAGRLLPNTVLGTQSVPASSSWEVVAGIAAPAALEPGANVHLDVRFAAPPSLLAPGADARLEALTEDTAPDPERPALRVLRYDPATSDRPGRLDVEAEWLGHATRDAARALRTARSVVLPSTLRLFTVVEGIWHEWRRRDDHLASGRADHHYVLDQTDGAVILGDGGPRGTSPPTARTSWRHTG